MALPHRCFTSVSFQTSTYRQSYTLKLQSIAKLQILSEWQNRTNSQQVDQIIQEAFQAHWESCSVEQRQALDSEFLESMAEAQA